MSEFLFKNGKRYAAGFVAPALVPDSLILSTLQGGASEYLPGGFSNIHLYEPGAAMIPNEPSGEHTHVVIADRSGPDTIVDVPPQILWVVEVALGTMPSVPDPDEPGTVDPKHDKPDGIPIGWMVGGGVVLAVGIGLLIWAGGE